MKELPGLLRRHDRVTAIDGQKASPQLLQKALLSCSAVFIDLYLALKR